MLTTCIPDFGAVAAQIPLLSRDARLASLPALGHLSLRAMAAGEGVSQSHPVGLLARLGWTFPTSFPSLSHFAGALPVPSRGSCHCHQSLAQRAPSTGVCWPTLGSRQCWNIPSTGHGMNGNKTTCKWEFPLLLKVAAFPGNLNWERSIFHTVGREILPWD